MSEWTTERHEAAVAREKAATAGEWLTGDHVGEPRALCAAATPLDSLLGLDRDGMAIVDRKEDAAFIVGARNDMADMLAKIEALTAAVVDANARAMECAAEHHDEIARMRKQRGEAESERDDALAELADLRKKSEAILPWLDCAPREMDAEEAVKMTLARLYFKAMVTP